MSNNSNLLRISPNSFKAFLDTKVVGQEDAKKALSFGMFYHVLREKAESHRLVDTGAISKRPNVLLMGDSGTGKTYILSLLCKALGVPLVTMDALSIAVRGWHGTHFEEWVQKSYQYSQDEIRDPTAMRHAVVFVDEVDKICMPLVGSGGTDHNRAIQHTLLTYVEGANIEVVKGVQINTSSMFFVFAGNFADIRTERAKRHNPLGFGEGPAKQELDYHQELIKFGMLTEFAGRVSLIAETKKLTRDDYVRALKIEGGVLDQYQRLFSSFGKKLHLTKEEINTIIDKCEKSSTGARALQVAIDEVLFKKLERFEVTMPRD